MDNDLQIGEKIRKQRIKANLTQEKLAEYSDLSINFISVTYTVIDHLVATYHYPVQEYLRQLNI